MSLSRQEFDDRVGVDGQADVARAGKPQNRGLEILTIKRDPIQSIGSRVGDHAAIEILEVFTVAHFDDVPAERMYESALRDVERVESQLDEARLALATLRQSRDETGDELNRSRAAQLAQTDPDIRSLWFRRQVGEALSQRLRNAVGADAPLAVQMSERLEAIDSQLRDAIEDAEVVYVRLVGEGIEGSVPMSLTELTGRVEQLEAEREAAEADVRRIADFRREMRAMQIGADGVRDAMHEADIRLREITGRIDVTAAIELVPAAVPNVPHRDDRVARASIIGGSGFIVCVLLGAFLAARNPKLRHPDADALADTAAPLFGTVPRFDARRGPGTESDVMALSIHEIRALLEVHAERDDAQAFAITSPTPGSGKTSLTVGIASSLALAGTRTLLVDCELVARHESGGDASKSHQTGAQSLDGVMIEMGFLDDHTADLLELPGDRGVGLVGMLEGARLGECIVETNLPGLALLPAVGAKPHHVGRVSSRFVRSLIRQAREQYDLILFDTGAVPGSVEALFVAAAADGVVLIISNGERQKRFDTAVAQLRLAGANLVGTVFNRAGWNDLMLGHIGRKTRQDTGRVSEADRSRLRRATMGSGLFAAAVQVQANGVVGQVGHAADGPTEPEEDTSELRPEDTGALAAILDEQNPEASVTSTTDDIDIALEAEETESAESAAVRDALLASERDADADADASAVRPDAVDLTLQTDPMLDEFFDQIVDEAIASAIDRQAGNPSSATKSPPA